MQNSSIALLDSSIPHHFRLKPNFDGTVGDDGEVDDVSSIESSDDVPSRNKLKMISEIKVDIQNNKHDTKKKKTVVKKPLSPSQTENKQGDIQESRPTTSDHRASAKTTDSQNPATPKVEESLMSPKMKTKPKPNPLDGVRAFLTELPPEE